MFESGNCKRMIRPAFTFSLLLILHTASAQRELIFARDPAALRAEEIKITHFNLPAAAGKYAAVRFLDVRPVRGYCGFIRPSLQQPARKMSLQPNLGAQLNAAVMIRKDSAVLKDTLIVVLKNFWLSRSLKDESQMYCRVHALFFSGKGDSVYYLGKSDTTLSRHAVVRYEFRDLPALFTEDLLAVTPAHAAPDHQPLPLNQFTRQAQNWISLPAAADLENGLLITFNDFMKRRFIPADLTLRPFEEQYSLLLTEEAQQSRYNGKLWGVWYNGSLYIRQGRHYSRAFPLENSYFILNNIRGTDGEYVYSYPLLLNLENGRLE